jgi:hypothetical protein
MRATEAGRTYLDLQNLARRSGRPTEELHQLYVLECFLDRLVRSPYADRFVLKGGVLLAAYDIRRPTRAVDLRADPLAATPEAVLDAVRSIAVLPVEDGVVFDVDQAHAETIRDEDEYSGVRVAMTVELASARMAFHVDVNVGDPVVPVPGSVVLPRLRGGVLTLLGYPPAAVLRADSVEGGRIRRPRADRQGCWAGLGSTRTAVAVLEGGRVASGRTVACDLPVQVVRKWCESSRRSRQLTSSRPLNCSFTVERDLRERLGVDVGAASSSDRR